MIKTLKIYNNACLTIDYISNKLFRLKDTHRSCYLFKGKKNYVWFSVFSNKKYNYIFRNNRSFYFYIRDNQIKEMSSVLIDINPIELSSYKVLCGHISGLNFLYFSHIKKLGHYQWEFKKRYPDIIYIEIKLQLLIANYSFFFTKVDTYI